MMEAVALSFLAVTLGIWFAAGVPFAFLCGALARRRGRSPFRWFLAGLTLNVFALLALFLRGRDEALPAQKPGRLKREFNAAYRTMSDEDRALWRPVANRVRQLAGAARDLRARLARLQRYLESTDLERLHRDLRHMRWEPDGLAGGVAGSTLASALRSKEEVLAGYEELRRAGDRLRRQLSESLSGLETAAARARVYSLRTEPTHGEEDLEELIRQLDIELAAVREVVET